jgi:hypothetical protein
MAGQLTIDTLRAGSGVLATQNGMTGIPKAWASFTSTPTIVGSFNVGSITKNGTGDYTVNFTTAMPNANYATNVTAMRQDSSVSGILATVKNISNGTSAIQTGSIRVQLVNYNGVESTDGQTFVSIFSS